MPIALSDLEASAWISFILGGIILLGGIAYGVLRAPKKAKEDQETVQAALTTVPEDKRVAAAKEISELIASLPEYQRFPGMLVLLGAALMGVGTVQFGGTSLF
jgi:hypothetical protein